MIGAPGLPIAAPVIPPAPDSIRRLAAGRHLVASLLSLFLGLFLADALLSFADDSLILFCGLHWLSTIRGLVSLLALLMALGIYGLMGLTPMIPKRYFLPVALFTPAAGLAILPMMVYFLGRIQRIAWDISLCQVVVALAVLYWLRGDFRLRWPLVPDDRLSIRRFSWWNLSVFLLVNVFGLLPAVALYVIFCAALAVDHFSDGFMAVRPEGFTVQVRRYVRKDGKTIQLVPMSHVGEPEFYRALSDSFPTNATILQEGVTDGRNLLTNGISYKRMAAAFGVSEQHEEFKPRGQLVRADVDVDQFTPATIGFLNLAMLIHKRGFNKDTLTAMQQYSSPPHLEDELIDDLLTKRNGHLLDVIEAQLLQSDRIIVPWGVAHMPGIAKGIMKSGFRLIETRSVVAIRFRSHGHPGGAGGGGAGVAAPRLSRVDDRE